MDRQQIIRELSFKALRSSGPGGQHVNKVASKVEVRLDISASKGLSDQEKARLTEKLKLSASNELILQCEETRSWHQNRQLARQRMLHLLSQHLQKPKIRKQTKKPKAAKLKRLELKKRQGEKKARRRNPGNFEE